MLQIPKFCGKLAFLAALIAIFMFLLNIKGTREKAWQLIKSDLTTDPAIFDHLGSFSVWRIGFFQPAVVWSFIWSLSSRARWGHPSVSPRPKWTRASSIFKLLTEAPSFVGTSLIWPQKGCFFFLFLIEIFVIQLRENKSPVCEVFAFSGNSPANRKVILMNWVNVRRPKWNHLMNSPLS